jgi:hypothetical protein
MKFEVRRFIAAFLIQTKKAAMNRRTPNAPLSGPERAG